jgi:MoaA/NifB/PqqE/SkfB family radical SAM enzyme
MAKSYCPKCRIQLFTNGWYLNQQMVDELLEAGVGMFMVSAYTDSEEARLRALDYKVPSESRPEPVLRIDLDDRMGIYDLPHNQTGPCWLPTIYTFINHKGQFALCCHDYKYKNVFGDLNVTSYEEVLKSDFRLQVCHSLENGTRFFDVCRGCNRSHALHEIVEKMLIPLED